MKFLLHQFIYLVFLVLSIILPPLSYALTIEGEQVIDKPITYHNIDLDLTDGRFLIKGDGILTIQNSRININISKNNPFFTNIVRGALVMKNNVLQVHTEADVKPDPATLARYHLINVREGSVELLENIFKVNTFFTVGLLETDNNFQTNNFTFIKNEIKNFHGGIYLVNSNNALFNQNTFNNVSLSNILNLNSNESNISNNTFNFPGNFELGDAIEVLNSNRITVSNNIITSSSSFGISLIGSENVWVANNRITDSLKFGISISSEAPRHSTSETILNRYKISAVENTNIKITGNYLSGNRFGLSGQDVRNLIVEDNFFVQSFNDFSTRKSWTDNNNTLVNITNLNWNHNLYKEAYTEEVPGDNSKSLKVVDYPRSGGVSL